MLRRVIPVLCLAALAALTACQPPQPTATPEPSPTPTATPAPTATPGRVPVVSAADPETRATLRFIVAVPDLPAVDLYVESALAAGRLTFGRLTSPLPLPPDIYTFRVVPAGERVDSERALLSERVDLAAQESVILVLGGSAEALTLARHAEDLSVMLPGKARIMVVNAMQGNLAVSASAGEQPLGTAQSGGLGTEPLLLNAGRYVFEATLGGEKLLSETLSFQDRQVYTALVLGTPDKATLSVAGTPARREARMRLLHASPTLGAVDIYLDDNRIVEGLDYGRYTEWQSFTPRGYAVRLAATGAAPDDAPLYAGHVGLNPDQVGTLVILDDKLTRIVPGGEGEGERVEITDYVPGVRLFPAELLPTAPGDARLSVMNLAAGVERIQVESSGQKLSAFSAIPYGAASPAVLLGEGRYQLAFSSFGAEPEVTVDVAEGLELKAGFDYLYVVTGPRQGREPLLLLTEVGSETPAAALTPTPGNTLQVRFINALDGVDADVYIGDSALFRDVKTGQSTALARVENAQLPVRLTRAGSSDPLAQGTLIFAPNGRVTLIGFGADEAYSLLQSQERFEPSSSSAIVRVIHAAPGVPPASLESPLLSGGSVFRDAQGNTPTPVRRNKRHIDRVEYPGISRSISLQPGTYTFEARSVVDYALLAELSDVAIKGGMYHDVLILPAETGARLVLIVTAP